MTLTVTQSCSVLLKCMLQLCRKVLPLHMWFQPVKNAMLKPSYGNLAALAPQPPRSASAMSPICNTLPTNLLEQCVEEFGHSRRRTKCKYFNVHEIHVRRFMITVEQNQRTGIRAQSCTESTYGDSRANLYTIYVRRLLRTFVHLRIPALVATLFFFFF